jgi:Ca-activated chloride channel homolog
MRVHLSGYFCARTVCGSLLFSVLWLGLTSTVAGQVQVERFKAPLSSTAALSRSDEAVINLDTQVVSLSVTVTDKQGRHLPNLSPQAFTIFENDVAQELSFFSQTDAPASIAVVFDLSGSMRLEKLKRAQLALERFLLNCHAEDEYSLIGFNDRAWVALDRTRDSRQLLRQFATIEPQGHTALYDAVALGLEHLESSQHPRRVLLLISEGEDNRSRRSFRQLKRLSQESAALVYAVGITDYALRNSNARYLLQDLAEQSGGKAFFPRSAEAMSEAFEEIALELRQQYSLGYTPSDFVADGKWRKLKVKVTPPAGTPDIVVRARTGYYANPSRVREIVKAEN